MCEGKTEKCIVVGFSGLFLFGGGCSFVVCFFFSRDKNSEFQYCGLTYFYCIAVVCC